MSPIFLRNGELLVHSPQRNTLSKNGGYPYINPLSIFLRNPRKIKMCPYGYNVMCSLNNNLFFVNDKCFSYGA